MIGWTRDQMAQRAARELCRGDYVNLGIGIPTLVANYIGPEAGVILQSENGMLGVGPYPLPGEADPDLVNAGKEAVTQLPLSSYFSSAQSFGMIRGGHIDAAILGAMEVSECGDIANWAVPGQALKGIGGAMDLVAGVRRVIVVMDHVSRNGSPKLRRRCTLPLTGAAVVERVITNLGVFVTVPQQPMLLEEIAPGVEIERIRQETEARFDIAVRLP